MVTNNEEFIISQFDKIHMRRHTCKELHLEGVNYVSLLDPTGGIQS